MMGTTRIIRHRQDPDEDAQFNRMDSELTLRLIQNDEKNKVY